VTPLPSHPAGAGDRMIRDSINDATERAARAFHPPWSLEPIQVIDCALPTRASVTLALSTQSCLHQRAGGWSGRLGVGD
jgi:hypothetical protein